MRELPSSQVVTQAQVVAFELLQEIVDGVDLWGPPPRSPRLHGEQGRDAGRAHRRHGHVCTRRATTALMLLKRRPPRRMARTCGYDLLGRVASTITTRFVVTDMPAVPARVMLA